MMNFFPKKQNVFFAKLKQRFRSYFQLALLGLFTDPKTADFIREIYTEEPGIVPYNPNEALNLFNLVKQQSNLDGEIAELGVFRGATAKIIAGAKKPEKQLFLFDTFQGLPEPTEKDRFFERKMFKGDVDYVRERLKNSPNVKILPGFFPESANDVAKTKFSFVHLDADLYESIREGLAFFWPRLVKGGVIVIHDFRHISPGVKSAVMDFLRNKTGYKLEPGNGSQAVLKKND